MKKTAVEWLANELNELSSMGLSIGKYSSVRKNIFEQAKEMEKEQIIQFATEYSNHILNHGLLTPTEFFKQNFKSK